MSERTTRASLRDRLRDETASLHDALERRLDLTGVGLSVPGYRHILEVFLGFYEPLEAALEASAPTFPLRPRAPLLERDILALGASAAALASAPRCDDLPALTRPAHIAGCLYVLEGARLGGQVVAQELERRLGITRETGAAFFVGEGRPATARRWRAFLAWLEGVATSGAPGADVVAGASATFRALTAWTERRSA